MDLVGSIITWVIGLPMALILGCVLGVGAFLAHRKYTGNPVARERILWVSFVVVLLGFVGVNWLLGPKWLLLVVLLAIPLLCGNFAGGSFLE